MTISAAPGHPMAFIIVMIMGQILIIFFAKRISWHWANFISNGLYFITAVLGMSTQSTSLVNLVGSNVDIVLAAITAASWGWCLQNNARPS